MPWLNCASECDGDVPLHLLPVLVVAANALAVAADRRSPLQLLHAGERRLEFGHPLGEFFLQRQHADADVDARAQLVRVKRLDDVVVRTSIEAGDDVAARSRAP